MRRGSLIQLVALGVVFGVIAALVAVLVPWLPDPAGREAERIDFVFWFTTVISIVIFAVVAAVIAYAVLRFRVKPDDDTDGPPIHGHTGLEIVWTAIPAVLVTAISIVSAVVLAQNGNAGTHPLKVKVIGQQFAWTFDYGHGVKTGRLVLPVMKKDQHVELLITAKETDVLHSFWVPQLGQKQDAVPGQVNKLVITPNRLGTFPVICTELCGLGHALMRSEVQIMEPAKFEQWLKQQSGGTPAAGGATGAALAAKVFAANGCGSCHTFAPAKATAKVGPDLDKLAAEAKRAGKPLEAFVKQSIVDPNAYVEPGFPKGVMPPNFGDTIKPNELDALVQYLTRGGK